MRATALGHRLETLNDGLTTFANGKCVPMPLAATDIHAEILAGVAIVKTARRFRNDEQNPIEAIMTFPVGFDAVVTGLVATIDGRRMVGVAKEKAHARETYETALDERRLSVLHEETLRGIHILSIGALPPDAEVEVELEQVVPLTEVSGKQFLRLPMTAGQLYGHSPLLPADDLVTSEAVRHEAHLRVRAETGRVYLDGSLLLPGDTTNVLLDRAVELIIEGSSFGRLEGRAADGRSVTLTFNPTHGHDAPIDIHVLFDRSGSTNGTAGNAEVSVWKAMRDGLDDILRAVSPTDRISLWQFDNECQFLGAARGEACAKLVRKLQLPQGGTDLANAVRAAISEGANDLLILTDGQTWAHIVDELKGEQVRISAILVGAGSLDANVGHLCAMTGGQVFYAPGADVASPLRSAFQALRTIGSATAGDANDAGPDKVTALRGGITIEGKWLAGSNADAEIPADAIGRFAAALAIPLLNAKTAEEWARLHSLCTHSTSLILVDEAGQVTEGFSQMRKVPNMTPGSEVLARQRHRPVVSGIRASVANYEEFSRFSERSVVSGHPTPQALARLRSAIERKEMERPAQVHNEAWWDRSLISRFVKKMTGRGPTSSSQIFANFEWDRYGDALLSGDFASLSEEQHATHRDFVEKLKRLSVTESATVLEKKELEVYALGLIARMIGGRFPERFARRALRSAPGWISNHALYLSK